MESTLVIKVNHGETLRRFNARVNEHEDLDLDMTGLKAKILSLFDIPSDADLTITYVDEDGDVVTLVDDEDLHDVMRQNLKFLRISVVLNNEKGGRSCAASSGSSAPLRSPRVQKPLPNISAVVSEAVRPVPEPLHESLLKLYTDFVSKATSSSPGISDFVNMFTKMAQSYAATAVQTSVGGKTGGQNGVSAGSVNKKQEIVSDSNSMKEDAERYTPQNLPFRYSSSKKEKEVDVDGVPPAPAKIQIDLNGGTSGLSYPKVETSEAPAFPVASLAAPSSVPIAMVPSEVASGNASRPHVSFLCRDPTSWTKGASRIVHHTSSRPSTLNQDKMSSSSSYNSPCAACKFLRRKCMPGCIFAPYFPPEEPQKFANVHKIFGASNVTKLLNDLPPHQREDAVNSLAYEAEARIRDPVYGCVGAISYLQRQVHRLQKELDSANADLIRYASCSNSSGGIDPMDVMQIQAAPAVPHQRPSANRDGQGGGFYQGYTFPYPLPWSDHADGGGGGGGGGDI